MPTAPKVQALIDLGFSPEMFTGQQPDTFEAFLQGVIDEQVEILKGRISSTRYSDTTKPMATYVARAEKALCAAELWRRRITKKLAQAISSDQQTSCKHEEAQRDHWQQTADALIEEKIVQDVTTDNGTGFSSGTVVTSHYA